MCLALACASVAQGIGWNQLAHYSLVRALSDGTPVTDAFRSETGDVAWFEGHYYAAKAPGLAFATLPLFVALDVTRARDLLGRLPGAADETVGMLWALGLIGCVLPALATALLIRRLGDEVEPGFGTVAAIAAATGTLLLPFATLFFAHVLATTLAFGAFAALWLRKSALLAGLLAGLAILADYPLALAALILAFYAASRGRRAVLKYVAGAIVGVLPLLAYQWWAFGSPIRTAYSVQVVVGGVSGHDIVGRDASGLSVPSARVAAELLFSQIGLLRLSPVLALAVVGIAAMYRRGFKAEALTVASVALAYVTYNSGYFDPFGGFVPGPRFLIPTLPFLGVALAPAIRIVPLTGLVLGAMSIVHMVVITATGPLLAFDGRWWDRFADGWFGGRSWFAVLPFGLLVAAAVVAALSSAPSVRALDASVAIAAAGSWVVIARLAPERLVGWTAADVLVVAAAVIVAAVVAAALARDVRLAVRWRSGRPSLTRLPRQRSSPI